MAGNNRDFRIDLTLRAITAQARGELDKAQRSIKGVGDAAGRLRKVDAGAAMRGLGVAAVAAGAVTAAVLGKYIANTIESEKVQAQLNARLKDTGQIAGRSLGQLNEQAEKLSRQTIFDDETIGRAQAMLLTFKQIRDVNFDRAVETATDLATVMGVEVADAAKLLGRALNDPERGLAALSRAGVTFTEVERDKIKAMVEAGRVADAQTLILNKLEGTMGSAAEAARDTLGGALQALRNEVDNLLEGKAGDGGMRGTREAVESLIEVIGSPSTKQAFDSMVSGFVRVAAAAVESTSTIHRFVTNWSDVTSTINKVAAGAAASDFSDRELQIRLAEVQKQISTARQAGDNEDLKRLLDERTRLVRENTRRIRLELGRQGNISRTPGAGIWANVLGTADRPATPDIDVRDKDKKSKKTDPEAGAKRRLDDLREEIALLSTLKDGEDKASEAAKIRYAITEGEFKDVSQALKQQLLDQAEILDQKQSDIEAEKERRKAIEESRKAFEDLKDELRTPAEVALDKAIEQVRILNEAARQGTEEYDRLLKRIADGLVAEQPDFAGLAPEIGGPFGELAKLDEAAKREEKWYRDSLDRLARFRAVRAENIAAANEAEAQVEAEHQERLRQIEAARQQAQIVAASATFGALADIARDFAGEQSQTYKVLFAISKGFAVAQAAVALAQNVAEASKIGFPQNLPLIAGAFAQGAQIAALLSQANYAGGKGYAEGGYTGPGGKYQPAGVVHKGEGVLSQEEIAAIGGPAGFHRLREMIDEGLLRERMYGWAGYANGGLVGNPDRTALPSPDWASHPQGVDGLRGPDVTNRLSVMNFIDPDELADALSRSHRFQKHVVNTVIGEGAPIRQGWQG